ncbi:MAG: hypothetical protein U5J78_04505 [Parasphingorhabdus sp.]|nr:hypothetical protein [Parasphingorhabdus sp.]
MNKILLPSLAIAALILSACGKQEAVGDVPSSEELAKQADAAMKAIGATDAPQGPIVGMNGAEAGVLKTYSNELRGFSINVPENWTVVDAKSGDDGRHFVDAASKAELDVKWYANRDEGDVAELSKLLPAAAATAQNGATRTDIRGENTDSAGMKSVTRLLRMPDNALVVATVRYPADQAKQTDPVVTRVIDSLTLI